MRGRRRYELALLALLGCDGVGRALVNHVPPGSDELAQPCSARALCDVPPPRFTPPQLPPPEASLSPCAFTQSPDGALAEVRALRECVLELSAARPTRVRLARAELDGVLIRLSGPLQLELAEQSGLRQVHVEGSATDAGEPSLLLDDARAVRLAVGGQASFAGALQIARSSLSSVTLDAASIELETVTLTHAALHTEKLRAVAAQIANSRLAPGDAEISASSLTEAVVEECGALLLARVTVANSSLGCRDGLRLHDSDVTDSVLDGPLEVEGGSILGARIGVAAPTRFWAWFTRMYQSSFCAQSEQVRVKDVALSCLACEGPLEEPDADVCHSPDTESVPRNPAAPPTQACPAFEHVPPCTDGFPERAWPD